MSRIKLMYFLSVFVFGNIFSRFIDLGLKDWEFYVIVIIYLLNLALAKELGKELNDK